MNIKYIPLLFLGLSLSACDPNSHVKRFTCKVSEVEYITGRQNKSPVGKESSYTLSTKSGVIYEFDRLTGNLIPTAREYEEEDSTSRREIKTYLQGDWFRYSRKVFWDPKNLLEPSDREKDELRMEWDTAINLKTKEFKERESTFGPWVENIATGKCEVGPPKNPYIRTEEEKQRTREQTR